MPRSLQLADIVQALNDVFDEEVHVARERDIGHVIGAPDSAGWVNVMFERTGRVSICAPEELMFLGDADTGRFPIEQQKKAVTRGN